MESTTTRYAAGSRLTRREQLVIVEIGLDSIASASSFVEYMSDSYGFSKSSVWYILNRLKDKGIVDFATKGEPGKALGLTRPGREELQMVAASKNEILEHFTSKGIRQTAWIMGGVGAGRVQLGR